MKLTHLAVTALAAALLLTGCTPAADDPAPSTSSTPDLAPTPAQLGEVIDPAAGLAEGLSAYKLPDGEQIAVSTTEPLPDPVVSDIQRRAAELPKWNGTQESASNASTLEALGGADRIALQVLRETGKRAVTVSYFYAACASGGSFAPVYSLGFAGNDSCFHYATHGEALAAAAQLVAGKPVPAEWIVIDATR